MADGEDNKVLIARCYHLQELITKLDEAILEQKSRLAERKDSTKHKSVTEGSHINFNNVHFSKRFCIVLLKNKPKQNVSTVVFIQMCYHCIYETFENQIWFVVLIIEFIKKWYFRWQWYRRGWYIRSTGRQVPVGYWAWCWVRGTWLLHTDWKPRLSVPLRVRSLPETGRYT